MTTFRSDLSNIEFPISEKVSAKTIRHSILHLIQKDNPKFTHDSNLSLSELNVYRGRVISDYLIKEVGELSELEKMVLTSVTSNSTLTDKLDGDEQKPLTAGQLIADKVASFGGSWTFIISFSLFILFWISINVFWLINKGFDPYPFILLNLILSCLAAFQAPVIMMSQNRQEDKDRERAKKDYMINLKSELEVRTLHEKIDHFVMDQQQELLELQKIQIEMMTDILKIVEAKNIGKDNSSTSFII
jgi:Predicted membrane protein